MSMDRQAGPENADSRARAGLGRRVGLRVVRALLMYVAPIAAIIGGAIGAVRLIETAPKAQRRPPTPEATLVRVVSVERTSTNAMVPVLGTVMPSQEVILQPRVSGEIVTLSPSFVPGGRFAGGDFILQIDPKDYELAIERARGDVAQAEYELKLENGYQDVAKREWELLNMQAEASDLDRELALRKPQLLKAKAALEAAKAALRDAELDLERTEIHAPFNCVVISENIDLGAQVTQQTQLGRLVGTDAYWVQAAVPVDQLRWIRFPNAQGEGGSAAAIRQELGTGVYGEWCGTVVRLLGDLEPQGRMARVLITVPDPLRLESPDDEAKLPLLIDAYVNVTVEGREVEDVIPIPRAAVRENDSLWIINDADELEIRESEVAWRNRTTVLVRSGIEEGERLVLSDLPAPVAGMALTVGDNGPTTMPPPALRVAED
jgi:RND family efflux transporter MFP subunit